MAKIYDIKLTSSNAPESPYTIYYDNIDPAKIASIISTNEPASNLTRLQLITGSGIRIAVPNSATSIIVYGNGCATSVSGAVADTTPPTAPTNLSANSITTNSLILSWNAASDAVGVTNYLIYRNGTLIATVGNVLTYNATGLSPSTSYSFTVYARDAAGNVSAVSNTANASTSSASFAFNTSTTVDLDQVTACSLSYNFTVYSSVANPQVGAVLYTDAALTTAWTGQLASRWRRFSANQGLNSMRYGNSILEFGACP
jgi:hypothetical protein